MRGVISTSLHRRVISLISTCSGRQRCTTADCADELEGATFLPQGVSVPEGMEFSAKLSNGRTIRGSLKNDLGHGFTAVDGYGLINAEEAALGR